MSEITWLWTAVGLLLLLVLIEACLLLRQRRTAQELARTVNRFMRGDYTLLPEKDGEGPFPALKAQLNLLAQRMQHHLNLLQKEKDAIRDFLYDVSHQLKTPLTTLHLYADMDIAAAAGEQTETRAQDFLSLIVRMESLVQALLKLARLESGTTELHFAEQNLKMTAEQVVTSQLERLSMRRQSVRIIAQDPVMVRYDNQWLGEALQNILINATNHAPEDSEITLAINSTDTIATLSISDCGPGITAEDLPHLFDRFYRSRSPADGQGSGLGLALAAQVLQRHHGSITAANHSEGGAIFTLTLPRYPLNVS